MPHILQLKKKITLIPIQAHEISAFSHLFDRHTGLLAISQSGETADTLCAAKLAKQAGSPIVSLTNSPYSTLARMSKIQIDIHAGSEIAVVSTKAFTGQLLFLHRMFGDTDTFPTYKLEKWLHATIRDTIYSCANKLVKHTKIFVLGKHSLYPIALETALKIKESSYIHAEGFAAGELKHGVIALIEKGVPCIVIDGDAADSPELISSAIQVKSRGAMVVGIGPVRHEVFDIWIPIPPLEQFTAFGAAIAGQLLGYELSIARGCDPDKPRNLAKSVTVK